MRTKYNRIPTTLSQYLNKKIVDSNQSSANAILVGQDSSSKFDEEGCENSRNSFEAIGSSYSGGLSPLSSKYDSRNSSNHN